MSLAAFGSLAKWLTELRVLPERCLTEIDAMVDLKCLHTSRLRPIQDLCARDLQPLCTLIQETIAGIDQDSDLVENITAIGTMSEVRSSTSHLRELQTQIRLCELEVTTAKKQTAKLLRIAEDRIKVLYADDDQSNIAKMGVVLRVSRQDSHRIQQQSGKALSVIRASRASGVWFSTPVVDSLGAKWKALKRSYEDAEASLVNFLSSIIQSNFRGFLEDLALRIAELDVLVSFALVSQKHNFVRASLSTTITGCENRPVLLLKGIFDPFASCDDLDANAANGGMDVDVSCYDQKSFLLLDGEEEPTKSSLLYLLGLVVLLNQLGCFVPCKEAVLPVFDAIYLRTGAYDQQLYGYSTFMTEMQEMSHIFSAMTPNSLVLIEDLCRGTSTSEGLALAISMCLHLMESKTITCFSSQWRELTHYLNQQPATVALMGSNSMALQSDRDIRDPSREMASIEKLLRDCDVPPEVMELVYEEMQPQ